MRRRPLLIAAIAIPLAILAYFWWWSRPEIQAPATFRRLAAAFGDLDAGDLMAEVHRGYDIAGHWTEVVGRHADPGLLAGPDRRQAASDLLRRVFLLHRGNRLAFSWRINALRPLPDGTVEVRADIGLKPESGSPLRIDPPLQNLRFILARDGWWPSLRIRDHDPVPMP